MRLAALVITLLLAPPAMAQAPLPGAPSVVVSPDRPAPPPSTWTLEVVTDRFLQRNLAVEAARYRVEAARAEQIAARLRPNPSLTVTAENVKISGPTPFGQLYEVSTTYAQPIEGGTKRRLRREVADLGVSVAEAQLAETLRQRLFDVKRAYYEALLARYALELARENRDAFDELVALNQARFEEGAIAEGELLKVRLERVKFAAALAQAELAVRQAGIRLLDLLGESDFSGAGPVAGGLDVIPYALDLPFLRDVALRSRPSLQAAERSVTLSERRVALEGARGTPDITPFVGFKRAGENNTVLFGFSVPLPLSDRNQAAVARAAADERVVRAEFALQRNHVLAEVESAYRAWETARDQVATFQGGLLQQADTSYGIALAAYREGAIELLGLLEAQRTRAEIRQQYFRSLADYRTSLLLLEVAVGKDIAP